MSREHMLKQWKEWSASAARMRDERARASCSRLCAAMVSWLSGRADPPAEDVIRAALRGKPSDSKFYGSEALAAIITLHPELSPLVTNLFRRASIPACQSILTYTASAASKDVLTLLVRLGTLHDAYQVRQHAVRTGYEKCLPDLLKLYEAVRETETDPIVIEELDRCTSMRIHGYYARFNKASWSWSIEFPACGGTVIMDVPKYVIGSIGIERAIEHMRAALRSKEGDGFVAWDEIVDGA